MASPTGTFLTLPTEKEALAAGQLLRLLSRYLRVQAETQQFTFIGDSEQQVLLEVPTFALRLLGEVLSHIAVGNCVKVVRVRAELTTQQAAELLDVSRPTLVKLLDEGVIPHTKAGAHRRVRLADLLAYKNQRDNARLAALDDLAGQAQRLKMGYD
ncbi:helix-turn-helix domain-containing protein [Pseudomonas nitroreducens]|uniref:helix-turn-helix domain-containing protein n=1 Tax=Pseudomonas nitroreducens TaxID=46680 RepID=UPI001876309F|nr:helix-turn-helix domain-containing protein [Pseudomonas nitritireducens]